MTLNAFLVRETPGDWNLISAGDMKTRIISRMLVGSRFSQALGDTLSFDTIKNKLNLYMCNSSTYNDGAVFITFSEYQRIGSESIKYKEENNSLERWTKQIQYTGR